MRIRSVLVVVAVLGALTLVAPSAHAATRQPFCTVAADLGSASGQSYGSEAKALAKDFKDAAKKADAPKKVLTAMKDMGAFYDQAAKARTAADYVQVSARHGQKMATATRVFSQHYAQECAIVATTTTRSGSTSSTGSSGSTGSTGGIVSGTLNGAPASAVVGSCSVAATSGSIRSSDSSFQLTWSGSSFTLSWRVGTTTYSGPVTGQVLGNVVSFTGSAGGVAVLGAATCV